MARVHIQDTFIDMNTNAVVSSGSATITIRDTSTSATLYSAETGSTTLSNPLTLNQGSIDCWIDEGSYDIAISSGGFTVYTESFEALNAATELTLRASKSIPVLGAWDGQQATDAVIAGGSLNQVTSSIVGSWAVGKVVHVRGAGASGLGFASTISSVSGTTATMAAPATTAVSGATITIGTDDTAAWVNAQAELPTTGAGRALVLGTGISMLGNQRIYLPPGCDPRGEGAGASIIQCFGANAQLSLGPAIGHGPESHGRSGDFLIDGGLIATQPLLVNATNGTLDTAFVRFANGDALIIAGQNYEVLNPNSAGNVGSCLVLDQGAGNIDVIKPQLAFAGAYHIEVRASVGAEGLGYGIPEFCRIHSPQCEGSNTLITGSPGLGCVHFTAGRWIYIDDPIFYTDAFTGTHSSLVLIEGSSTGRINPDPGYNVVGDLHFHNPTFQTGSGLGYGIEIDNVDGSGVAQQLFSIYRPYTLTGKILAIGLNKLERVGTTTPGLIDGEPIYA